MGTTAVATLAAWPSVTVTWNVNTVLAASVGTTNCGRAVMAPVSATAGPPVWNQANARASPSASAEVLLSSVTVVRSRAPFGPRATATGAWLAWFTVTFTVDTALFTWPSFTTSENVSVAGVTTSGAVNVGVGTVAL